MHLNFIKLIQNYSLFFQSIIESLILINFMNKTNPILKSNNYF